MDANLMIKCLAAAAGPSSIPQTRFGGPVYKDFGSRGKKRLKREKNFLKKCFQNLRCEHNNKSEFQAYHFKWVSRWAKVHTT